MLTSVVRIMRSIFVDCVDLSLNPIIVTVAGIGVAYSTERLLGGVQSYWIG